MNRDFVARNILIALYPDKDPWDIDVLLNAPGPNIDVFLQSLYEIYYSGTEEFRLAGQKNWDGLARSIMLGFDSDCLTPRKLLKHLERCIGNIPDWLLQEPEMKNLDHVISKGTRCVLIYKAMTESIDPRELYKSQSKPEKETKDVFLKGQPPLVKPFIVEEVDLSNALSDPLKDALDRVCYTNNPDSKDEQVAHINECLLESGFHIAPVPSPDPKSKEDDIKVFKEMLIAFGMPHLSNRFDRPGVHGIDHKECQDAIKSIAQFRQKCFLEGYALGSTEMNKVCQNRLNDFAQEITPPHEQSDDPLWTAVGYLWHAVHKLKEITCVPLKELEDDTPLSQSD